MSPFREFVRIYLLAVVKVSCRGSIIFIESTVLEVIDVVNGHHAQWATEGDIVAVCLLIEICENVVKHKAFGFCYLSQVSKPSLPPRLAAPGFDSGCRYVNK